MERKIKIGIIGDFDGRRSHVATEEALKHSAKRLNVELEYQWLYTSGFDDGVWKLKCFGN